MKPNKDLELTEEQTRKIEESRNSYTNQLSSTHSISNNKWLLDQDKLPFPGVEVPRIINIQEGTANSKYQNKNTELSIVQETDSPIGHNKQTYVISDKVHTDQSTQENHAENAFTMKSVPPSIQNADSRLID